MAVAVLQAKTATSGAGTNTGSATFDTAATAGNLILYLRSGDKNTGALTMAGYTSIAELLSTSVSLYMRWKVAAGGETAISATTAANSTQGDTIYILELADAAVPGATWIVSGSATNITDEASVTSKATGTTGVVAADGLAIALACIDSANGSPTYAWSNSYTTQFSTGTTTTGVGQMSVARQTIAAGATTSSTVTMSTGNADQISAAVAVFSKISPFTPSTLRPLVPRRRAANW